VSQLLAFRAGHYDDPDTSDVDGVLDLSGVLDGSASTSPDELTQPHVWAETVAAGRAVLDRDPGLYLVRVGWKDEDGRPWQRAGVIGVTASPTGILSQPATVVVSDDAFTQLVQPEGVPLLRATSVDGRHFRVWTLQRNGFIETISEAFHRLAPRTASPFVLATADFFEFPAGLLFCLPDSLTPAEPEANTK
jgi:hypothetical protein